MPAAPASPSSASTPASPSRRLASRPAAAVAAATARRVLEGGRRRHVGGPRRHRAGWHPGPQGLAAPARPEGKGGNGGIGGGGIGGHSSASPSAAHRPPPAASPSPPASPAPAATATATAPPRASRPIRRSSRSSGAPDGLTPERKRTALNKIWQRTALIGNGSWRGGSPLGTRIGPSRPSLGAVTAQPHPCVPQVAPCGVRLGGSAGNCRLVADGQPEQLSPTKLAIRN